MLSGKAYSVLMLTFFFPDRESKLTANGTFGEEREKGLI